MNILIVDDEIDLLESLTRGLRRKGYGILNATSPQQGLNFLHNRANIDMVITDYVMPLMNGIEFLESIRKNYSTLPVIIMTAYGKKDLLVDALYNSCNGYIEKPFTLDQLSAEIERVRAKALHNTSCEEFVRSIPMLVHQIKNPLMVISGTAEMAMLSANDSSAFKNHMNRILIAANELSKLNNEMLNAARQKKREKQIINITELINNCLDLFEDLAAAKGIELQTSFPQSPVLVEGHEFDLEQLFKNIIMNSIDAMEEGKRNWIKVSVDCQTDESLLAVSLADSGSGIARDSIEKLFIPYFTTKQQGTGLGLAVVKKVVEEHDGEIEIESEVGKGSTFKLIFRALLPEQSNRDSLSAVNE